MYTKIISWPRKHEQASSFQDRLNHAIQSAGEIEELRLFERGDFVDAVLLVSERPSSGQVAVVQTPDDLEDVIDLMNTSLKSKETNAKLIGLLPLNGGGRYVGTVICRPVVEEVKRDAEQGQDAAPDASAKRGKQRRAISGNSKPN